MPRVPRRIDLFQSIAERLGVGRTEHKQHHAKGARRVQPERHCRHRVALLSVCEKEGEDEEQQIAY